jgi:ABC-type antimicrobial peptide transport system permease subunit
MKKIIIQYLKTAWYNILHNKGYAIFCFAGTALTFIFVVLVLQLVYIFASNYPPISNADRIIRLDAFQDTGGKELGNEIHVTGANSLLENLKVFDNISLYHYNYINMSANGRLHSVMAGFVNADFWKIYDFDFLYGRSFTKEECINQRPAVVITENMSQTLFNTKNGVGKKITFQSREYEVGGVVKDISLYSSPTREPCTVWAPYVFDKFIPNMNPKYVVDVLAPSSMSIHDAKENVFRAVNHYFENKNIKVDFPLQKVKTLKEARVTEERNMFQYGGMIALFLFLLIPALNILSLGNAHTNNRAEEIAIRRAFGAGRLSSFLQIMTENLLLVVAGSIAGLFLAVPAMKTIQQLIIGDAATMENLSLVGQIDYVVIFAGVLPAMLVFSLLSGGLPAYLISKRNIAEVLKGNLDGQYGGLYGNTASGTQDSIREKRFKTRPVLKMVWNQRRSYSWIFTEQVLVTVILMLLAVSVLELYKKYKTPGMLNVEDTFIVGCVPGNNVTPEEWNSSLKSMNVVLENLKKLPYVKAITVGFNLAPYQRDEESYAHQIRMDSIRIDDKRFLAIYKFSDEFGISVLNVKMEEGAWFENKALPDGSLPCVITRQFADKAGWTTAVGKKISFGPRFFTVTGVATGLKQEPFKPSPVAIVVPSFVNRDMIFENLARIKPGMEVEFTEAFFKEFRRLVSSENIESFLGYMPSMERMWVFQSILPIVLQGIPTLFLFIFAFIGTFGLYWMISQKRMKEFALRIAVGSTKKRLMNIVISESLLITCVAVLPALLLSFFIYDYTIVHVIAISVTVLVMLLFAVVSAWYPAWTASRVNPAETLQYE